MIGCEPPVRNPGPPDFEIQAEPEGRPIPCIEEYEDGSAKLIRGDESEWVKRPDEGEGKVASIDFYPCDSLRDLIHKFQLVGAIRTDVASQIVAQIAYDKDRVDKAHEMARMIVGSQKTVQDYVESGGTFSASFKFSDDAWERVKSGKGNTPGYGYHSAVKDSVMNGLDLEYSAIGDKSEPKPWDGVSHKVVFINVGKQVPIDVIDGLKKHLDDQLSKLGVKAVLLGPGLTLDSPSDESLDELGSKVDAMAKAMTDLSEAIARNAESTVKLAKAVHDAVLAPRM